MDFWSSQFNLLESRWQALFCESRHLKARERSNQGALRKIRSSFVRVTPALLLLGALALGWCGASSLAFAGNRGIKEKIAQTDWAKIRGVNFIPSYASNTYEIWRNYNHDVFDRDLRLASIVGYNSVRLWLNYAAYEKLGPKMVDHVEDALRLCTKYHLRAVIVLFDSCGIRPRKDTQWMTALAAYKKFQASSRFSPQQKAMMRRFFSHYVHGLGANTLVPVAPDTPMMALVYQRWVPTPGNNRLGPDWYPRLEKYIDAIIGRLKDNPNVLLWDLMNEPEWASEGPLSPTEIITPKMKRVRDAFLRHFHSYIKRRFPDQILGMGWASLQDAEKYSSLSDVITFHVYGGPGKIQSEIGKAEAFSKRSGKNVLITETLANWDFGSPDFGHLATDEEQLKHYQEVLPVLMKSPIGWMGWGLVISRDFDPYTDIFYPDGIPRPAALYLEKTLKGSERTHPALPAHR